jgi:hypothetical protein
MSGRSARRAPAFTAFLLQKKPRMYIEVLEDQLEVLREP